MSESIDPAYLELKFTHRNTTTGEALETTFFKVGELMRTSKPLDFHALDIVEYNFKFTAFKDEAHDNLMVLQKDLGQVSPCRCYENLMKG